uniref:PX domain-containing protein n=1 Tax=Peronospora matthiolae TaxID=2874970 RepID=A0AAV1TI09_9STRA
MRRHAHANSSAVSAPAGKALAVGGTCFGCLLEPALTLQSIVNLIRSTVHTKQVVDRVEGSWAGNRNERRWQPHPKLLQSFIRCTLLRPGDLELELGSHAPRGEHVSASIVQKSGRSTTIVASQRKFDLELQARGGTSSYPRLYMTSVPARRAYRRRVRVCSTNFDPTRPDSGSKIRRTQTGQALVSPSIHQAGRPSVSQSSRPSGRRSPARVRLSRSTTGLATPGLPRATHLSLIAFQNLRRASKAAARMTSLATLSVRVTGFDYSTFHTYTTVVTLENVSWTVAIRYRKYHAFFEQLRSAERSFKFDFPPKSGLFYSPKPEERKLRLDAFMQSVTAFYFKRRQPRVMSKLLREFLQVDKRLKAAKKVQKVAGEAKPMGGDKKDSKKGMVDKKEAVKPKDGEKIELSKGAQEGKKVLEDAAIGAAVVAVIKDNAVSEEKKETTGRAKKEEGVKGDEKVNGEVKVDEVKLQEKKEEAKVAAEEEKVVKVEEREALDVESTPVKVEAKEVAKAEEEVVVVVKEEKQKAGYQAEVKLGEGEVKMEKEDDVKGVPSEEVKVEEGTPSTTLTTTTTTTTTTTMSSGSTVVETNVMSQLSPTKTVVDKTVTITSNSDDQHSFKVEMTERKKSVVTLLAAAKDMVETVEQEAKDMVETVEQEAKDVVETAEQKAKKKKRNRKKSVSKAPLSSASTVSDGFESPDGVDDVGRVSDLSESQKKARNQRRKEKRKKKQKRLHSLDLKA